MTGIVRAHAGGAASHRQVRVYAILLPRLPRGEAGVREVGHVLLRCRRPQTRRRRPYRRVRVIRVVRVVRVVQVVQVLEDMVTNGNKKNNHFTT